MNPTRPLRLPLLLVAPTLALCALAVGASGCKKAPARPKGIGKALASVPARNLSIAPGGQTVVFVGEVAPPPEREAPEGVFQGILTTVPVAGGVPRQLGGGVSTLDDGYRISPDGKHVAYLQGFRFRSQSGSLHIAPLPEGDAREVAPEAKYYLFSPDSRWLGYVAAGEMHLRDLQNDDDRVIARNASSFEFSKDSRRVLVRRSSSAGGDLLLASVEGGEPSKLGEHVGDYGFSPSGAQVAFMARVGGPTRPYTLFYGPVGGPYERSGDGVSTFRFSPDEKWVALVDGFGGRKELGDLHIAPTSGGPAKKVAENVKEYRWSPASNAIAVREKNESKGRVWTTLKIVAVPGTLSFKKEWGYRDQIDNIPLAWSADGSHLAYVHPVVKPEVSFNLYQVAAAGGEERMVAPWVFGFQYSPDGRELWYRTECSRAGRECDLLAIGTGEGNPQPRTLIRGIGGFKPAQNGKRLLVWYLRGDTDHAVDLGWLDLEARQPSKGIDQYVLPGAQLGDEGGNVVVYIVNERKREGVYAAELR